MQTRRISGVAAGIAVAAVFLTACSGSYVGQKDPEPNVYPKEYKAQILIEMQRTLEDPTKVRDAYISEPVLARARSGERYQVCIRSNSRDISGNYTGSTDRVAYFFGGFLNQLIEATPEQCGKANYQPWPELQNVCFSEKGCK